MTILDCSGGKLSYSKSSCGEQATCDMASLIVALAERSHRSCAAPSLAVDAPQQGLTRFPNADDDGEKETRVLEEYIKQTDSSPRDDSRSPRGRRGSRLSEGDSIEARYRAYRCEN